MSPLANKCILIVEDEPLVAMLLEDMLIDVGVQVVGPATTIEQAVALVQSEKIDGAILDVNLNGKHSVAVADALRDGGVPFLFATGYGSANFDAPHNQAPVIAKPYQQDDVHRALAALFS